MSTATIDDLVNESFHPREQIEKETELNTNALHLTTNGLNDDGNADCVLRLHKMAHNEALGWLFYSGTHWNRDGANAAIVSAIVDTLKARIAAAMEYEEQDRWPSFFKYCNPSSGNVRGAEYLLRSMAYVDPSEFDCSPNLLNCANGVVDLRTGEIEPHNSDQKFTYCSPIAYRPDTDHKKWLSWLLDATGNQEIVDWLQVAVGYSLTGHTREEILFYIYGPPRSGKGLFTETLLAILGTPLAQEINFSTFTAQRNGDSQNFDLAPLKAARLIAASESNSYERFNDAKVKALTGGNQIYCAFKHKTHFGYRPQFKIWLSSNQPVNADPDDDAVWGRLRIIEFPHSHLGKEDKEMKARMLEPKNLEGILAWAIEGAIKWYQLGSSGLPELESSEKSKKTQRSELDNVQAWIDERCKIDPNERSTNSEIYSSYRLWCESNGVEPKKQKSLTQALANKGFNRYRTENERGIEGFKVF